MSNYENYRPRSLIVEMTCKVCRKRREFVHAVSRGMFTNEEILDLKFIFRSTFRFVFYFIMEKL